MSLTILDNQEVIELFEISLNDYEGFFRFHGSKNHEKNLVYLGLEYLYIPCEMSFLEYSSEGRQTRPSFTISNTNNYITNLLKDRNDLLARRLYKKKIFARDLDDENFGGKYKSLLGSQTRYRYGFINVDTFVINKKKWRK